jgi:site-specific DNA-adenine methylase
MTALPTWIKRPVPFVYCGVKAWMAPFLDRMAPSSFGRLFVPAFGRGEFLRSLRESGTESPAVCTDVNARLMAAHEGFRDFPEEAIRLMAAHKAAHSFSHYRLVRDRFAPGMPPAQAAADFAYAMNGSYKGIYRQDARGACTNESSGRSVTVCAEGVRAHSAALRNTTLRTEDFAQTLKGVRRGDWALLDLPYMGSSASYGFPFGAADYGRLAYLCTRLHGRGALFLVTHAADDFIRHLFRSFHIEEFCVRRVLGRDGKAGDVTEMVITNY